MSFLTPSFYKQLKVLLGNVSKTNIINIKQLLKI